MEFAVLVAESVLTGAQLTKVFGCFRDSFYSNRMKQFSSYITYVDVREGQGYTKNAETSKLSGQFLKEARNVIS